MDGAEPRTHPPLVGTNEDVSTLTPSPLRCSQHPQPTCSCLPARSLTAQRRRLEGNLWLQS